ncbi:MAG: P-loop NTPase fold protein [Candidatus Nealsonbacteria bacterium]
MTPFFIGITGGSGSGKTELANKLSKLLKSEDSVFHIDNYQKFEGKLPKLYGMKNWDHPKSIDWGKLIKDLVLLKKGKTIVVKSRDQKNLKKVRKLTFKPSKIIIIEGYFLLHKPLIRKLLDFSVYLKAGEKTRLKRRTKFKNPNYVQKVLLPMHQKYIEPTKRFANLILDTEKYSSRECAKKIISKTAFS